MKKSTRNLNPNKSNSEESALNQSKCHIPFQNTVKIFGSKKSQKRKLKGNRNKKLKSSTKRCSFKKE